jgi:lipopolysaccharide export system permease protein
MRILDRYILKSALSTFFGCLAVFFLLYVIIDVFSHLEEILKQHLDLTTLAYYYLSFLPIIFIRVVPVACLLSVLYTFGILNRNNEIIAMRAAGLSILQITKTVIILGFLVSIFVFWLNDRITPRAMMSTQKLERQLQTKDKKSKEKTPSVINNVYLLGSKNRLFSIDRFYPYEKTIEGIIILEQDQNHNLIKKIFADKGVYKNGLWVFSKSITYTYENNAEIREPVYREEEIMAIPETPEELLSQRQSPDFMNIKELDDYIWKLTRSGALSVAQSFKVDFYARFFSPFTNVIIVLLGIPFALKMKRRAGGLTSVGLSIIVVFLYFVLNAVTIALGKSAILAPILGASLSHLIMLAFALILISDLA